MSKYAHALGAGLCGALASVCGKVAADASILHSVCSLLGDSYSANDDVCTLLSLVLRVMFLVLTLFLNGMMWSLFIESMQVLLTSEAVVLNTGSNILTSALMGRVLFGDKLSAIWWFGASLIIVGMALLHSKQKKRSED